MPVNVRRFCTSALLSLIASGVAVHAQTPQQSPPADAQAAAQTIPIKAAPTSAEIMRDRISKAKAFIAVRNYNAAIYELENIRRETSDSSVQAVTTVLLMNSYLEQRDYKRAQDFLTETFNLQKSNRPNASEVYSAIAGQVVKGARTKVDRYRSLGLMVSDRNLPLEAVTDIEHMRETLELVITQAKENGKDIAKAPTAMALLEEATSSRSLLARDDYDARRWKDEVADSREQLANGRSVITNAVDGTVSSNPAATNQTVAMNNPVTSAPAGVPVTRPAVNLIPNDRPADSPKVPAETLTAANDKPAPSQPPRKEELPRTASQPAVAQEQPKPIVVQNVPQNVPSAAPQQQAVKDEAAPATAASAETGPLEVGSLLAYATNRAAPVYPPAARTMRASGVVKVEVTVDENGEVTEVQKSSGPTLLQAAAKDAVRKWRFKPFTRDGQPVRATGFVNFNFTL